MKNIDGRHIIYLASIKACLPEPKWDNEFYDTLDGCRVMVDYVRGGVELFDITKPIPKADADLTEAQMMLYALKDGMDPDCAEAKQQYREMRN